jgi:16S rRNA (uracil1498-N3)-methyltransferase
VSRQSFLDPAAAAGATVGARIELSPAEAHHARVKRLAVGEEISVVDGAGLRLVCAVAEISEHGVFLDVLEALRGEAAASRPRLVLVQALSKQDRDLQAVESCVEIGIDAVVPWQADRSIVRWREDRASKAHAKWEHLVASAVKQSRRDTLPPVEELLSTKGLVARTRAVTQAGGLVLILHESATTAIPEVLERRVPTLGGRELLLVVGPEGGISEQELDALRQAGAEVVILGREVLRASTAGTVALVLVLSALGAFAPEAVLGRGGAPAAPVPPWPRNSRLACTTIPER